MTVKVYKIEREPHPDPKSATKVFIQKVDGGVICMSIPAWEGQTLAAHLPPGAVVDTFRREFEWLNPNKKVESRYFTVTPRNIYKTESFGMMAPVPDGAAEGDDVTVELGVSFAST